MWEYVPPEYGKDAFNCSYCNAYANQQWERAGFFVDDDKEPDLSVCARCDKATLWLNQEMIYPHTPTGPPPNSDLPENVTEVYEEAAAIAGQSFRAAGALLRLGLEMLLKDLGEEGSINEGIKSLVQKGLDEEVQQACDVVRVTGNHMLHPGQIDVQESSEDIGTLLHLINFIADELITRPKKRKELFESLPIEDRRRIEVRDRKT